MARAAREIGSRARRDPDRAAPEPPPRREQTGHAVLALQRAIGNQSTMRYLARQADKNRPNFEHSVKVGKLGPLEITGGNVAEWAAKKNPDGLKVISPGGTHSGELERLHESKAKIDTVRTNSVVGENTLVTIDFGNCRITRYSNDGEADDWMVEFETAKRQTLSIGAPRR